jgi:crotonobetainyl-CoA:carnitine CoA-transferase CaiB-like acyl-CoA transferase
MPPLNLVADFGGGSMLVLLGIAVALYEWERSGTGQVVDAAMVDGVSLPAQMMWTMKSTCALRDERESFPLDVEGTVDGDHRSRRPSRPRPGRVFPARPPGRSDRRRRQPHRLTKSAGS